MGYRPDAANGNCAKKTQFYKFAVQRVLRKKFNFKSIFIEDTMKALKAIRVKIKT
jgi:hypothetical protein